MLVSPDAKVPSFQSLTESVQRHIAMFCPPERSEGAPPPDYFDLIGQIRSSSRAPPIVLSESDDVTDKVEALETGADSWCPCLSQPWMFHF
jgi:hypothetical protein